MKKELFAAVLLFALFAGGAYNTSYLEGFTGELCEALEESEAACEAGDYSRALALADAAHERWHSREAYTGIFIRHTEIDAVTYGFHDLVGALEAGSGGAREMYPALAGHVRSLYEMERVGWASVF